MNQSEVMNTAKGKKVKVIDSLWTFAVAVAFIGPLALPLLWRNPRFERKTKVIASMAVFVVTLALLWISWASMKKTWHDFQQIQKTLNGTIDGTTNGINVE
ncbi:MAG: hypothetical protein HY074_10345 [Deltaproteobacteria bacterium]|nr:hypothetical protein [Deltaproteobacteria bacterium]